jgi:hypothetical protein
MPLSLWKRGKLLPKLRDPTTEPPIQVRLMPRLIHESNHPSDLNALGAAEPTFNEVDGSPKLRKTPVTPTPGSPLSSPEPLDASDASYDYYGVTEEEIPTPLPVAPEEAPRDDVVSPKLSIDSTRVAPSSSSSPSTILGLDSSCNPALQHRDHVVRGSLHLLQLLEGKWIELMSKSKIVSGIPNFSHWTTGEQPGIGYEGIIDSGAYGDVFQVHSQQ